MAFRRIGEMPPERLRFNIAAAQRNAEVAGELDVGPTYSAGISRKPDHPAGPMNERGPLEGAFGSGLNAEGKGDERAKRAKELAQMWATQWSNGPFGPDVVPGVEPAPTSKEAA